MPPNVGGSEEATMRTKVEETATKEEDLVKKKRSRASNLTLKTTPKKRKEKNDVIDLEGEEEVHIKC